jgi:MFS transporter, BCD family, chlorophyll transporter
MSNTPETEGLSVGRNIKIGFFHLGSGMADVLTTGVWNRIMISDLGFSATITGLLLALRYFLAPVGVWAGRVSDERAIGGYRRLFWVWLGRFMMVFSTVMLGAATAQFARSPGSIDNTAWVFAVIAMVLFSVGSAFSGGTFLSLIYDRAPAHQRGRAVGIVWTFLLLGFTIGGIFFSIALPEHKPDASGLSFTPDGLFGVFVMAAVIFAALWLFSLLGEEKRSTDPIAKAASSEHSTSLREDLKLVWQNRPMRFFLFYLTLSMFFAFSQDAILEPWAGDVFEMPVRTTSRFTAYWGSMSILGTILFLWLSRRYSQRFTMTFTSQLGAGLLVATFAVFTVSSLAQIRGLVTPGLILLGLGLGVWNVGTLGLMMHLSPAGRAGTFLGFWSMAVTLARGGGVASGGLIRDILLQIGGTEATAYGVAFVAAAVGLLVSMWSLRQVDVKEFQASQSVVNSEQVLAGAMD